MFISLFWESNLGLNFANTESLNGQKSFFPLSSSAGLILDFDEALGETRIFFFKFSVYTAHLVYVTRVQMLIKVLLRVTGLPK